MNKKIGIVSPHKAYNYGTVLQAYALVKAIKKMGVDSEYIDYSTGVYRTLSKKILWALKDIITQPSYFKLFLRNHFSRNEYDFWNSLEFQKIREQFDFFCKKHIPISEIKYDPITINSIKSEYSNFIVGSDQTWSPLMQNHNTIFFLEFLSITKLKNSYAPSVGAMQISDTLKKSYKKKLQSFNHLSCRENTGCKIIEELTHRKVKHVLDPTLLITSNEWNEIADKYPLAEPYILCYILGKKKAIIEFAKRLGIEKNLPVHFIRTSPFLFNQEITLDSVAPSNFLYLISHAQYVCTDSYHGTIFSINFNRNFYSFSKREGDENNVDNIRILDVLKDFSLITRYKKDAKSSFEPDIDFTVTNQKLVDCRLESMKYLEDVIHV